MHDPSLDLAATVQTLRQYYGPPEALPTADPFELVLWENVAYLASPARRRDAFAMLRREVGTTPGQILAASQAALERVTAHGILKGRFATKLRACARIAIENFGGDLRPVIHDPLPKAKQALRRFPGIGEPGAEKVLLFARAHTLLAPDSNALRVLARLGFIREDKSYARMYAAGREVASHTAMDVGAMQEAHQLLQQHGQTLCKRNTPLCGSCPLATTCHFVRGRTSVAKAKRPVARKPSAQRKSPSSPLHRPARRTSRASKRTKT
jgi:endonuclease III